ncbi:MAG: DUF4258 domain-containing protein [Candidatus Anammoxibacter sp.]
MSLIGKIRKKVIDKEYEFADIRKAIATGMIRRKFTKDPRGLRYEIAGKSIDGREIGVICRIKSTGKLLFITVYAL